jgi:hypothetical protein
MRKLPLCRRTQAAAARSGWSAVGMRFSTRPVGTAHHRRLAAGNVLQLPCREHLRRPSVCRIARFCTIFAPLQVRNTLPSETIGTAAGDSRSQSAGPAIHGYGSISMRRMMTVQSRAVDRSEPQPDQPLEQPAALRAKPGWEAAAGRHTGGYYRQPRPVCTARVEAFTDDVQPS